MWLFRAFGIQRPITNTVMDYEKTRQDMNTVRKMAKILCHVVFWDAGNIM